MKRLFVLFALVALGFTGTARAQSGEFWFDAGASLLSNRGLGTDQSFRGSNDDVQLNNGFRFGFRFCFNQGDYFGHEVQYAYSRTQLQFNDQGGTQYGMAIHQGGYNFLGYGTKEGGRVRPFGTFGIQFSNFVPPGSSATSGGGDNKFGFNYGAGVKVKVSDRFGARFDVRQYVSGKPFGFPLADGLLRQTEVSAGFGFLF
jgi:opacity protein-like surface antigen